MAREILSHSDPFALRHRVLAVLCGLACFALFALLAARGVFKDPAGASSYAALAEAFLNGRLHIDTCPEVDCALFEGKTYVVFPPLPALLLTPVVAITGAAGFKGGVWIAMAMIAGALWLWNRIFSALDVPANSRAWLLAAIAFASPVYLLMFMGAGVWFLAQTTGFLLATLAIASVVLWRSLPLAGVFVALALHCRQMTILYPLFLFALVLAKDEKLFWPRRETIRACLLAAIPILISIAVMFAYNYARFGNAFDTGYGHISNPGIDNLITRRSNEIGLFSPQYVLYNFYHLFVQGFHLEFGGRYTLTPQAIDMAGTAIVVASPWLFLLFYARLDRVAGFGFATIGIFAIVMLFYSSNGYEQINTQRYALDWTPMALVLLARQSTSAAFAALPLLVSFGVFLNLAAYTARVFLVP